MQMCRSANRADFLLCVFGTEVLSYMRTHEASLACRPGLLQTRFHLHQRFKHHGVIFRVDRSVLWVETRAHSHFDLHSCRYNSFMWQPDKAVFLFPGLNCFCLSLFATLNQFISTPCSRLIFCPLHLHTSITLPLVLLFYVFSFVLCPSVLVIECRSSMTLMKNGGRSVINHLLMSARLCTCVFSVCVCTRTSL